MLRLYLIVLPFKLCCAEKFCPWNLILYYGTTQGLFGLIEECFTKIRFFFVFVVKFLRFALYLIPLYICNFNC